MRERVAVVGSRSWPALDLVRAYVRTLARGAVLVSGGAAGVDQTAMKEAKAHGMYLTAYYPRPDLHGSGAGYAQHRQVVANCDRLAVFVAGKGARHYVEVAREMGRDVEVFEYRGGFQL